MPLGVELSVRLGRIPPKIRRSVPISIFVVIDRTITILKISERY